MLLSIVRTVHMFNTMAESSSLTNPLVKAALIIWILLASLLYAVSLANSQCSCYTFYDNTTNRDWDVSNKQCTADGGQLVSMETLEEWEFIKKQLQTRTTSSRQDQWWVGLTRENGVWQWASGGKLTYNRWKTGLQLYTTQKTHAIIEKYQGILWNTYWYLKMGSICEQKKTNCGANQVKRCYNYNATTTTNTPTKTTLRESTVAFITSKVERDVPQSTEPIIIVSYRTTLASVTSSTHSTEQVDTDIRKKQTSTSLPMKILIIIIVTVVMLLIIGICICRRRYREKARKKNKGEQEKFILQPQSAGNEPHDEPKNQPNNEPISVQEPLPCIYATVDKTAKARHKTPEPIYENWRKPMYVNVEIPIYENFQQPNHCIPQELNYVSVSECTGNGVASELSKPLEYEPTEYAILDVNDSPN